jgi:membrane protein DedA with SNARE-associated domain
VFDIITSILASLGGFGVFLLMLAENVFPPIPSEVILPLAGYTAAQGRGSLWVVAIAGTLGSAAGGGAVVLCRPLDRHRTIEALCFPPRPMADVDAR